MGSGPYIGHPVSSLDWAIRPLRPNARPVLTAGLAVRRNGCKNPYEPRRVPIHRTPRLLIVLGIVLLIFGPKRLPGLGRQLGAGMREFKDSITSKADDDDDATDDAATASRREATAALGRPEDEPAPPAVSDGVASESARRRRRRSDVDHPAADPARGSPEPCRAPRRAAHAADRLRHRVRRLLRGLPVAGRRDPRHRQPPARADGVQGQEELQGPVRAHGRVPGAAAQVGAGARRAAFDVAGAHGRERRHAPRATSALAAAEPARWRARCRRRRRGARSPWASASRSRPRARRRLRGAAARPAAPALPGLRVRPTGVLARGAIGRAAADDDGAVPVHRRRRFAYFLVLPNAINFLQNFNDDNYDILVQAKDYYRFAILVLVSMGDLLPGPGRDPRAHARWGSSPWRSCASSRRYAILVIAVVAMLLPGPGPRDDALADGPALRALRGLYPVGIAARSARRAQGSRRAGIRPTTPNPDPCSSTSEAPAGAAPSKSSTSRSPS